MLTTYSFQFIFQRWLIFCFLQNKLIFSNKNWTNSVSRVLFFESAGNKKQICLVSSCFLVTGQSNENTPARTHSISGLKSRVLKLTFFSLKMMVKSGLQFILKLTEPLQRYLLTCQANSALLGRFFCTGQQQL